MPLFCDICNNLLNIISTADSFHFQCSSCLENYQSTVDDSLRYENIRGTNLVMYQTILSTADKDPMNPKVYKDCSCGSKIVRQVRLNKDMRLVNACISCGKQWIEGSED